MQHLTNDEIYQIEFNSAEPASIACIGGMFNLRTKEVERKLGSPRLFQRCRFHKWLVPLVSSRDALYPAVQVLAVQQRLQRGESPPLLPSEVKTRAQRGIGSLPVLPGEGRKDGVV